MNTSTRQIPKTIKTERLLIRAARPEYAPEAQAAVLASLETLKIWMPWARLGLSLEDANFYARGAQERWAKGEEFNFYVWEKVDQRFLGAVGIHNINWAVPRFEIGYWLHTAQQGQGYITEAVKHLTAMLLVDQGAKRVEIRCDADNKRSVAVAERCGFVLEARLRHERRNYYDELADTLIYVRFPED